MHSVIPFSWKGIGIRLPVTLSSTEYFSIPKDDKEEHDSEQEYLNVPGGLRRTYPSKSRRSSCRPSIWQLLTLVLFVAFCSVAILHIQLRNKIAPQQRIDCGDSFEEAEANGCTFDQLIKAWLPPSCPRYGLEEYIDAGRESGNITGTPQWPYWKDQEKTQVITIDYLAHMATNDVDHAEMWYTTGREHMTHCAWMLIRMAYVYSHNERLDMLVSDFHHAKHCTLFLLDRGLESPNVDSVKTIGNTVFGGC
ncbi:hypothetical protein F5Y19DRAFT_403899 [Xylariaceae sp. FL1651]|nr:hypothetical protein F5Y19DRAFT_403899 [Xylariaceae sp. FL1651]